MREILFRGKRIDNGKWVEGDYQRQYDVFGEIRHLIYWTKDHLNWEYFNVDPSTVCQYTGLTDREGRKIFEGDICKYYNSEDKDGIAVIKEYYAEWVSGTIHEKEIMTPLFYLKCSKEWEVIGNIFDNPDLIGE